MSSAKRPRPVKVQQVPPSGAVPPGRIVIIGLPWMTVS